MESVELQSNWQVRWYDRVALWAGAAMLVLFFLPIRSPQLHSTSPVWALWGRLSPIPVGGLQRGSLLQRDLEMVVACVVPYLFGVLMALGAWVGARQWRVARRALAWMLYGLLAVAASCIILRWVFLVADTRPFTFARLQVKLQPYIELFWPVAAVMLLIYLFRARRGGHHLYDFVTFAGSLILTIWFSALLSIPNWTIANGLTVIGCLLLLVSTVFTFRRETKRPLSRAIKHLLACRLPDKNACPRCDYNLYGLTQQRCPECGRGFTFEELGVSPEELGFTETPIAFKSKI